jgi:hypothetical protein
MIVINDSREGGDEGPSSSGGDRFDPSDQSELGASAERRPDSSSGDSAAEASPDVATQGSVGFELLVALDWGL